MLLFIVIMLYLFIFLFDYQNIKKNQSKKENTIYIIFYISSFFLLIMYVLDFQVTPLSDVIRGIIKK